MQNLIKDLSLEERMVVVLNCCRMITNELDLIEKKRKKGGSLKEIKHNIHEVFITLRVLSHLFWNDEGDRFNELVNLQQTIETRIMVELIFSERKMLNASQS